MTNKRLGLVMTAVAMVLLAGFGIWQAIRPRAATPLPSPAPTPTSNKGKGNRDDTVSPATPSAAQGTYTVAQVAEHDKKDDCWTIIDASVYNLTSYVSQHPGGDEIERACGVDGSSLFNTRHTAEGEAVGSGTAHSSNAKEQLQSLKIGTVTPTAQ